MIRLLASLFLIVPFLLAEWVSPHDPVQQFREHVALAPGCNESVCHLLGTDDFGRDVLARLLHGGRLSLVAGIGSALLAVFLGGALGCLAGSLGGWIDALLSRPVDLILSLPWLYLLLAARAALPLTLPGEAVLLSMMLLVGFAGAATPFRIARQTVASARISGPVQAARGLGASRWYILRAHLLPAAYPALVSCWLTLFPAFVLAEVSLSFLGLGVGDPAVSWGSMLASLRHYPVLMSQWWIFSPAVALALFLMILPSGLRLDWRTR